MAMRKARMLTAREFAEAVNAAYTTVMGWLKDKAIPGAIFDDSSPRGGVWFIPESAVDKFKQDSRSRGRPRKASTKDGPKKPK
jgi:hypothetical protein